MKAPLVVKLGSSLVVDEQGRPRRATLKRRAAEIAAQVESGTPVCVVSSGAIARGLAGAKRPAALPKLQAASALGQAALQRAWQDAFKPHGLAAAQILLTSAESGDRRGFVNVRATCGALFAQRAVPVVNENDVVATDEISFGDNDALAAQVAVLLRARLLVLLTSVPGVLREGAVVADGSEARTVTFGPVCALVRGCLQFMVAAAVLAAGAGIPTVIGGATPAFKLWLRHGKRFAGRFVVVAGARSAEIEKGASLLAVGITSVEGAFRAGDGVELVGPDGAAFARGLASVDSGDIAPGVEAVHRDRLVLL